MKKINLAIAILTVLATIGTAQAADTSTTTTQYLRQVDESTTSNHKLILPEKESDKEIIRLLDAKINSYDDLRNDISCSVQDGVVNLKGIVGKTSQRDFVAMIAAAVPGVIRVDNLISVK